MPLQIAPKVYVAVRVGDVLRFGQYVLHLSWSSEQKLSKIVGLCQLHMDVLLYNYMSVDGLECLSCPVLLRCILSHNSFCSM